MGLFRAPSHKTAIFVLDSCLHFSITSFRDNLSNDSISKKGTFQVDINLGGCFTVFHSHCRYTLYRFVLWLAPNRQLLPPTLLFLPLVKY